MTGGADGLGVAGTTPIDLVNQNYASVFTTPQTTNTTAEMITLSDKSHITPTLTFNGNAYFRSYAQAHVDGNVSDFYSCGSIDVCNNNDATPTPIAGLRDPLGGTAPTAHLWARSTATGRAR